MTVDTSNAEYKRAKGSAKVGFSKGVKGAPKAPAKKGAGSFDGKMDSRPESRDRNQSAR